MSALCSLCSYLKWMLSVKAQWDEHDTPTTRPRHTLPWWDTNICTYCTVFILFPGLQQQEMELLTSKVSHHLVRPLFQSSMQATCRSPWGKVLVFVSELVVVPAAVVFWMSSKGHTKAKQWKWLLKNGLNQRIKQGSCLQDSDSPCARRKMVSWFTSLHETQWNEPLKNRKGSCKLKCVSSALPFKFQVVTCARGSTCKLNMIPPDASRCLPMPPDASRCLPMPPDASRCLPPLSRLMW